MEKDNTLGKYITEREHLRNDEKCLTVLKHKEIMFRNTQ